MNEKILQLLSDVYGNTFSEQHIASLFSNIEQTERVISKTRKQQWDERDVVLITYADQFRGEQGKPLAVFNDVYQRWFSSVFSHVHLLPFYPWSSDDGFSVKDYYQVDPNSGEWGDVQALSSSAKLMFDFVCNHISAHSEWFKQYLNQTPEYKDFFIEMDPATDLSAVTRPRALPLLTPFTLKDGSVRSLWTTFSDDQLDLNYACPDVLLAMVDVLLHYLKQGAEYIRLDAVGFMWKEPGTSCIHLQNTHRLIKLFRAIVERVAPGTVIITETNVPHKDNIAYFGNGTDEAHMVYQFSLPPLVLHSVLTQDVSALCQWGATLQLPSAQTTWFNFLASHDGIGLNPLRGLLPEEEILSLVDMLQQEGALVNWKQNPDGSRSPYEVNVTYMDALNTQSSNDDERLRRFILAHAILLSFPGVPAIYIQSILGSRNDYLGVERLGYNRAINREKYISAMLESELQDDVTLRHKVYHSLSALIKLRRGLTAFHPDSQFSIRALSSTVMQIIRRAESGEVITALFNVSRNSQSVCADITAGVDLISGETLSSAEILLQPWQVMWIKK